MPEADALKCPSCGFPADPVDLANQGPAPRCRICGASMNAATVDDTPSPPPDEPLAGAVLTADGTLVPGARPPVPLPPRFTVSSDGGGLHVQRAWRGPKAYLLAAFCVMWFGFLIVWYAMALPAGNRLMLLLPLFHVAAGLLVLYAAVAHFVNRTHVDVADGYLTVRHEPLPWPGARRLESGALDQLFTRKDVSRTHDGTTITYSVHAQCRDGRTVRLLGDLPGHEQALFVEQQVERHLRIADRPVPGEWGR